MYPGMPGAPGMPSPGAPPGGKLGGPPGGGPGGMSYYSGLSGLVPVSGPPGGGGGKLGGPGGPGGMYPGLPGGGGGMYPGMPGGGSPYPGMPGGGAGGQANNQQKDSGTITLTRTDKVLVVKIDIEWKEAYPNTVQKDLADYFDGVAGQGMLLAATHPWQKLSQAVKGFVAAGKYPRRACHGPAPTAWACRSPPSSG